MLLIDGEKFYRRRRFLRDCGRKAGGKYYMMETSNKCISCIVVCPIYAFKKNL